MINPCKRQRFLRLVAYAASYAKRLSRVDETTKMTGLILQKTRNWISRMLAVVPVVGGLLGNSLPHELLHYFSRECETRYEVGQIHKSPKNLMHRVNYQIGRYNIYYPNLRSRTHQSLIAARFPQKKFLGRHSTPAKLANINYNLINLSPAMT